MPGMRPNMGGPGIQHQQPKVAVRYEKVEVNTFNEARLHTCNGNFCAHVTLQSIPR